MKNKGENMPAEIIEQIQPIPIPANLKPFFEGLIDLKRFIEANKSENEVVKEIYHKLDLIFKEGN